MGFFCSFDGCDAVGKTTQALKLAAYLGDNGISFNITKEPGGSYVGAKIRHILITEELDEVEKLFLFLSDRANHVREVIKPSLEAGKVVISDRYHDSTVAYQFPLLDGLNQSTKDDLRKIATRGLEPDLTFIIDLPAEEVLRRMKLRNKNNILDKDDLEYYKGVRNVLNNIWETQNENRVIVKIDGMMTIDEIHQAIVKWFNHYYRKVN